MSDSRKRKTKRVEDLEGYGRSLSDTLNELQTQQLRMLLRVGLIVLGAMRNRFGLPGLLPFARKVSAEEKRLKREYPEGYQEALKLGKGPAAQMLRMSAMFNVIAQAEGPDQAYEFIKGIFQRIAVYSMPAMYQIDDLVQCEGDVFDNFKKYNIAMFQTDDDFFRVKEIQDEKDKLTIILDQCANVTCAAAFRCPEVAKLGCDHDLAGYPVILDRVDAEFRRPHTIAKGDDFCDFMFYRKGTAPDTEYLNK